MLPAQAAQTGSTTFYGINFVAPYDPWLTLARQSGARAVRWQFNWRDHEPIPGQWDWRTSDEAIRAWTNAGLEVHAILHFPPDWAIQNPGTHGTPPWVFNALMPRGIGLPWDHPDNGWGRYCYNFALRYRGQIASYEVWNEPDLDNYWDGSPADYVNLLRSCYQAIKSADPGPPVVMAGMALLVERDFFPEVVRLAASDPAGPFFDAANIHMYADPDLAYRLTVETREVLSRYGLGSRPIWITETNVALRGFGVVADVPQYGYATEEEAAWFMLQTAGNAHAAGAARVMFFRLADDDMDTAFGLVRNDGTPRPSYRAVQLAASVLRDIVEAHREEQNGVVLNIMRRADGARIVLAYARSGQRTTVTIPAETRAATLIYADGRSAALSPTPTGEYVVTLEAAPNRDFGQAGSYSVGGPPLILVEYDQAPPAAALEVSRLTDGSGQFLVRWSGYDGEYGTGVAAFDVEIQREGGPWEAWRTGTTDQEALFDLAEGGIYHFRVRAVDRAGNVGEFSGEGEAKLVAVLMAQVVDLRGQGVPFAVVTLADGSQHIADAQGIVRIEREPGPVSFMEVDGGERGLATPPEVTLHLDETLATTWELYPRDNLVINGEFTHGSLGWTWHSPGDVTTEANDEEAVLQINGRRRPWGTPGASFEVNLPPTMTGGLLRFSYRIPDAGAVLRIRAVTATGQRVLWQTDALTPSFRTAWVDVGQYAGQHVTFYFELWGAKSTDGGRAEIDRVILANIPVTR